MGDRIENLCKGWKNSYKEIYLWLKGELLDIQGMIDAMAGREVLAKI